MIASIVVAIASIMAALLQLPSAVPHAWRLSNMVSLQRLSDVRISSDGKQVLFDIALPAQGTDAYHLLNASGRSSATYPPDLAHPRWSPDAERIAWISSDPKGATRIVVTDVAGKNRRILTGGERTIVDFSWSPDSRAIAAVETGKPAKVPRLHWMSLRNDYRDTLPPQRTIWIVDAASGHERLLTHDSWSYGGPATDNDPSWAADGTHLAAIRQPTPLYADFDRAQYVSLDVRSGTARQLVRHPFFAYPGSAPPQFPPSGNGFAYVQTWDGRLPSREDLYVGGRDVSAKLNRDLWSCGAGSFSWQQHTLVANMLDGVSSRLYRVNPRADGPEPLTDRNGSVEAFSVARTGRIAYIWSTPTQPGEVYLLDPGHAPRQLTYVGHAPSNLPIEPTRYVRWPDGHGHTLGGQLTVPANADLKTVPLIVNLHGGPQCSDDSSFDVFGQYFASNGYANFRPDPAGSDGYGDWSYKAIIDNWGARPMADDMAGVAAVLRSGVGDPHKLYLFGGSYGGYLTSWIVSHTNRFKAAVAWVPPTDLLLEATLSESPNIMQRFFGMKPTLGAPLLAAQSPQTYVARMHTPLLLMIGLQDTRAPYAQAIEYYKTLAERGAPVALLADPQSGHGPEDPQSAGLWLSATMGWIASHGGPPVLDAVLPAH